jgi:hypothetical protein
MREAINSLLQSFHAILPAQSLYLKKKKQKDTAGPSLHVVIKLLSTTILVAGPLFIANMGSSAYP